METLRGWIEEYSDNHRHPLNKRIHLLCIPLLYLGTIGLLTSIPHHFIDKLFPDAVRYFSHFGSIAVIFVLAYYLNFSIMLFFGMMIKSAIILWIVYQIEYNQSLPLWLISLLIFGAGLAGQFIGHRFEGTKPSFLKNGWFLFISPAWLLCNIYRKIGIKC